MQPEQPETPATEAATTQPTVVPEAEVAKDEPLPVAEPVRAPVDKAAKKAARAAERERKARVTKRVVRAGLISVAVALTGVFAAAFRIYPYDDDGNPRTMSTHTQLGMPPCNFVTLTGKPCPACGMTTSFALLVRGDVVSSLRANWVGSIICVTWALTLVWAVASAIRGQFLFVPPRRGELTFTFITGFLVIIMFGRWLVIMLT